MDTRTAVQLRSGGGSGAFWSSVDQPDTGEGQVVKRASLDLPPEVFDFADRVAAYRNALARVQKVSIRTQWSRKTVMEQQMMLRYRQMLSEMEALFSALGDLPDADDAEAMDRYAARAIALDKKRSK